MKPAKILFFVDGHAPTAENFAEAAEMKATVVFRNARAVPSEPHSLEICDGVAGKVPGIYAEKYPKAEEAIAAKAKELQALTAKVGDTAAPKATGKGNAKAPAPAATPAAAPAAQTPAAAPPAWTPNPTA